MILIILLLQACGQEEIQHNLDQKRTVAAETNLDFQYHI